MLRYVLLLCLLALGLAACSAPALPTLVITPDPNRPTAVRPPTAATTAPQPSIAAPGVISTLPVPQASVTTQAPPTVQSTNTAQPTAALSATARATSIAANSPTWTAAASRTRTATVRATPTVVASELVSRTNVITATATLSVTRVPATPRPRPTATPRGPATLTRLFGGQRVTAMYVGGDGTIYYGVAPSDESLQFPDQQVFQLWKWSPGGAPIAITPDTMRMIGGVLVYNGMIYFNELGALRRMPDNGQSQEGQVVIRFPMYPGNRDLPYGHMNHALAVYTLNGQEVLLMAMGSLWDSSFPGAGLPASRFLPDYEPFPTGRIVYATFDWLNSVNDYVATNGVAGQFDELARGVRNPWGMTVGVVNGQTHILAVDDDPAFTPEKSDGNPANAGDELNDIRLATNYGHPYVYAGQEPALGNTPPIVVFDDGTVPSGVAVAAGKVFVGLTFRSQVVKVDLANRTYTPVLTGISPFNLFGVGNLLYIADFDGVHVIDAGGL